jgi:hypothetical protein
MIHMRNRKLLNSPRAVLINMLNRKISSNPRVGLSNSRDLVLNHLPSWLREGYLNSGHRSRQCNLPLSYLIRVRVRLTLRLLDNLSKHQFKVLNEVFPAPIDLMNPTSKGCGSDFHVPATSSLRLTRHQ